MQPSQAEKNVFGDDVKLHPVTRMPLEQGIGALSEDIQAMRHIDVIEQERGKDFADAMRIEIRAINQMATAEQKLKTKE